MLLYSELKLTPFQRICHPPALDMGICNPLLCHSQHSFRFVSVAKIMVFDDMQGFAYELSTYYINLQTGYGARVERYVEHSGIVDVKPFQALAVT